MTTMLSSTSAMSSETTQFTKTSPSQNTETIPTDTSTTLPSSTSPETATTTTSSPTPLTSSSVTTETPTAATQSTESTSHSTTSGPTETTTIPSSTSAMSPETTQFTETSPTGTSTTLPLFTSPETAATSTSSPTPLTSTSVTTETPTAATQSTESTSQSTTSGPTETTTMLSSTSMSVTTVTPTGTTQSTESTTPQCTNCHCNGGTCVFNVTLGRCQCVCQNFVFGENCNFGINDTTATFDNGAIPTRKANFTLEINIEFDNAYNNLSSPQSVKFIETLEPQLEVLCKSADPQSFKTTTVIRLSPGSVVADSVAVYGYTNNESQIQFVNNQLDEVLTGILNNTSNLKNISLAFENKSVQFNTLTFQPPPILNITDLKPFVNCSKFAGYTAEVVDGEWQCAGPCKTNPDYCNHHGDCLNEINLGAICRCYGNSLEQYYGPRCENYRRGPGFFGALFGSLAAALLLLIVIIIIAVIIKKRRTGIWKRSTSFDRGLSAFEEDFFDFSDTGNHNFGFAR
ncbi:mucin-3B [Parambassis ranga]|uniref:Mucin-3B-like n=1 Tax=Parambassis ranga TaxID=210632 RepID=A0A6P7IKD0_9TELE|nr:mucin-3B-like [Parambassis ranga]XP_028260730.1 mucin-3B-like [Parambassis ranga]